MIYCELNTMEQIQKLFRRYLQQVEKRTISLHYPLKNIKKILCSIILILVCDNVYSYNNALVTIDSIKVYAIPLQNRYVIESNHDIEFVRKNYELYSIVKDYVACRNFHEIKNNSNSLHSYTVNLEKIIKCRIVIDFYHQGKFYESLCINKSGDYFFYNPGLDKVKIYRKNAYADIIFNKFIGTYFLN